MRTKSRAWQKNKTSAQKMRSKMAASHGSGCQSPPTIGRTVDRVFEEAQFTGEILLNGRKLRDYPKLCAKYDLSDTVLVGKWQMLPGLWRRDCVHVLVTTFMHKNNTLTWYIGAVSFLYVMLVSWNGGLIASWITFHIEINETANAAVFFLPRL